MTELILSVPYHSFSLIVGLKRSNIRNVVTFPRWPFNHVMNTCDAAKRRAKAVLYDDIILREQVVWFADSPIARLGTVDRYLNSTTRRPAVVYRPMRFIGSPITRFNSFILHVNSARNGILFVDYEPRFVRRYPAGISLVQISE